mmetsp:Transcript_68923/g.175138  ORF Transcript_68923/g.175138 Transcript_68923/m.175138 type:complete len:148 (+) Transcript_68923:94-537(+)
MELDKTDPTWDVPLFAINLTSSHASMVQVQLERVLGMPRTSLHTPVAAEAEKPLPEDYDSDVSHTIPRGQRRSAAASSDLGTENSGQAAASLAALPPAERSSKREPLPSRELGADGSVTAVALLFPFGAASGVQDHWAVPLRKRAGK